MGSLEGKTVIDLGAGSGFFAFEMAASADKVIATELDPLFLDYMKEKKERLGVAGFEIRRADSNHSELEGLRADYALMVYVFHYLEDPKSFLASLKKALQPGGRLYIANAQLSPVIIKDYLELAGFAQIKEVHFVHELPGCGPQPIQLISGQLPVEK